MAFDVNTITVQGAIAIASATAGNKLVIDGCDAVTSIYTQAQAVQIASRPATPDSTTTSIALAGSTENHVYAYASFIQGETGQPGGDVHSFLLYGHSENTPNVVVVVAVASSTAPVHLPEPGDVTNRTEVQFELSFSATDEVVTVAGTSMYTTRGEFLLLKNRTVTTHAEGETTVGDDQTIYGDKKFADGIAISTLSGISTSPITLASSMVPSGNTVKVGTYDSMFGEMCSHYFTYFYNANEGYVQSGTGSGSYGTQFDCTWFTKVSHRDFGASFYARTRSESGTSTIERAGISLQDNMADVTKIELLYDKAQNKSQIEFTGQSKFNGELIASHLSAGSELELIAKNDDNAHTMALVYFDATVENEANISIRLFDNDFANIEYKFGYDGVITAYADGFSTPPTTKLGASYRPFGEAHVAATYTNNIYPQTSESSVTTTTLLPDTGATIGSSSSPFPGVYSSAVYATHLYRIPSGGATMGNIGTSDDKFLSAYIKNIYSTEVRADQFYGCIQNPSNNTSAPPVGSIFLACVDMVTTGTISAGDTLNLDSSPLSPSYLYGIRFATIKYENMTDNTCSFSAEGSSFGEGKYRALSGAGRTGSSGNYAFCLLMRIE